MTPYKSIELAYTQPIRETNSETATTQTEHYTVHVIHALPYIFSIILIGKTLKTYN